MVSFEKDLFAVQGFDEMKVRACLFEIHCPRDIARNDNRIAGRHDFVPVFAQPIGMIFPGRAENIHRLVAAERKMQVADRKNRNKNHFFQMRIKAHARERL